MVGERQASIGGPCEQQADDVVRSPFEDRRTGVAFIAESLSVESPDRDLVRENDISDFVTDGEVEADAGNSPRAVRGGPSEFVDDHVLGRRGGSLRGPDKQYICDRSVLRIEFGDGTIHNIVVLVRAEVNPPGQLRNLVGVRVSAIKQPRLENRRARWNSNASGPVRPNAALECEDVIVTEYVMNPGGVLDEETERARHDELVVGFAESDRGSGLRRSDPRLRIWHSGRCGARLR